MKRYILLSLLLSCLIRICYAQDKSLLLKSDSLFAAGVDLFNSGKYREAIPFFTESDKIDKAVLDSTSNRRGYSAMWLASCYYYLGDTLKAKSYNYFYDSEPIDRRLTLQSDSLAQVAIESFSSGDISTALSFFYQAAQLEKLIVGEHHPFYGNSLYSCCYLEGILGNYSEAIRLGTKVMDIFSTNSESPEYAQILADMVYLYTMIQSDSMAISLGPESLRLQEKFYTNNENSSSYLLTLESLSSCYQRAENYNEALSLALKGLSVRESITGKYNAEYIGSLSNVAVLYYNLGKSEEAIQYGEEALQMIGTYKGKECIEYAFSLRDLSLYYSQKMNFTKAIQLGEKALNIFQIASDVNNMDYVMQLKYLANDYMNIENYTKAIEEEKEACKIIANIYGKQNVDFISSMNNIANCLYMIGKFSEALPYLSEVLMLQEVVLGKEHMDYAATLELTANVYMRLSNYPEAIRFEREVVEIREKTNGRYCEGYCSSLNILAECYYRIANIRESSKIANEALIIAEKTTGKNSENYAISLDLIARGISYDGDIAYAIQKEKEILNIYGAIKGENSIEYAVTLNTIAGYYLILGNMSEAESMGKKALRIYEKSKGKLYPTYATILTGLGDCYINQSNYTLACRVDAEALGVYERIYGKDHPDFALAEIRLARDNCYIGNYSEAVRLGQNALKIIAEKLGTDNLPYVTTLASLAISNLNAGSISHGQLLLEKALENCEKVVGKTHLLYTNLLIFYALNKGIGDIDAIELLTEVVSQLEKTMGVYNNPYIDSIGVLALLYGDGEKARDLLKKGIKLCEESHYMSSYCFLMNELIKNYVRGGEYQKCVTDVPKLECQIESLLLNNFKEGTLGEHKLLAEGYKSWFNGIIHQIAYNCYSDSLLISAVNGSIFYKGLLLSSEMEFNRIIKSSQNPLIKDGYEKIVMNKKLLNKQIAKAWKERTIDVDSLTKEIDNAERQLMVLSKEYGDYTKNLKIKWQDIQANLDIKDVCVEFSSFFLNEDSTMYIAYVIDKKMHAPKMIPLFEEKRLIQDERNIISLEKSKLVWEPLANFLIGVNNIYFAPSGELYNIPIESLPHWSGEGLMSDVYNMYRLSSTREIAMIKDKHELKTATVYGGLKFDTDTSALVNNSKKYKNVEREMDFVVQNISDTLHLRNGVNELPATKIEAVNVGGTLNKARIDNILFIDTLGTEASFKDLSGKKVNLLHVATHGFYWTEREAQFNDRLDFLLLSNDNNPRYVEDKALTRSGLLLAGANNALRGEKMPEGLDDGILTAKEISQLDLRGLDLVVLSACQTGLGEVTGDGVFGLQRGFKKAGANSLLMTLWKVDDNATQLLMTRFYENLFTRKNPKTGKKYTKFEALKDAQRYVRDFEMDSEIQEDVNQELIYVTGETNLNVGQKKISKKIKPYQNPIYWAGFILLDAID